MVVVIVVVILPVAWMLRSPWLSCLSYVAFAYSRWRSAPSIRRYAWQWREHNSNLNDQQRVRLLSMIIHPPNRLANHCQFAAARCRRKCHDGPLFEHYQSLFRIAYCQHEVAPDFFLCLVRAGPYRRDQQCHMHTGLQGMITHIDVRQLKEIWTSSSTNADINKR